MPQGTLPSLTLDRTAVPTARVPSKFPRELPRTGSSAAFARREESQVRRTTLRSSKPAGRRSPAVGRFDSFAAPSHGPKAIASAPSKRIAESGRPCADGAGHPSLVGRIGAIVCRSALPIAREPVSSPRRHDVKRCGCRRGARCTPNRRPGGRAGPAGVPPAAACLGMGPAGCAGARTDRAPECDQPGGPPIDRRGCGCECDSRAGRHDLGTAVNGFGGGRGHEGQDIFAGCGTRIVAARTGRVVEAATAGNEGNYVVTQSSDGRQQAYLHLLRPSSLHEGPRRRGRADRQGGTDRQR